MVRFRKEFDRTLYKSGRLHILSPDREHVLALKCQSWSHHIQFQLKPYVFNDKRSRVPQDWPQAATGKPEEHYNSKRQGIYGPRGFDGAYYLQLAKAYEGREPAWKVPSTDPHRKEYPLVNLGSTLSMLYHRFFSYSWRGELKAKNWSLHSSAHRSLRIDIKSNVHSHNSDRIDSVTRELSNSLPWHTLSSLLSILSPLISIVCALLLSGP